MNKNLSSELNRSHPRGHDKPEAEEKKGEHKEEAGAGKVKLDKEQLASAGIQTAHPVAARVQPELKGYGRVLDPAPLAALWNEQEQAQAALEASAREFERTKTLFAADQNASARSLEQAAAARRRDQLLLDSAKSRLLTGWGRQLSSRPDLAALIQTLSSQETALLRLDLPPGEPLGVTPAHARVQSLPSQGAGIDAEILGPAPAADPLNPGQGFLLLVRTGTFPAGTAVAGFFTAPGEPASGVTVPRSAILRHDGEAFVYLQTGEGVFERKEIELTRALGEGWFVAKGLKPEDTVVVTGAQQLLSEELKGHGGGEE